MASRTTVDHLFQLLSRADPEVRVAAFAAIYRITGDDHGKDAAFWRDENERPEHPATIRQWWERLR